VLLLCSDCGEPFDGSTCPSCGKERSAEGGSELRWDGFTDLKKEDGSAEAKIVGEVQTSWKESSVIPGATADDQGKVSQQLFYVASDPASIVKHDSVPVKVELDAVIPLTPFEQRVIGFVDGASNVGQICAKCGLSPQEVVATFLGLVESGIVRIAPPTAVPPNAPLDPSPSGSDLGSRVGKAAPPLDPSRSGPDSKTDSLDIEESPPEVSSDELVPVAAGMPVAPPKPRAIPTAPAQSIPSAPARVPSAPPAFAAEVSSTSGLPKTVPLKAGVVTRSNSTRTTPAQTTVTAAAGSTTSDVDASKPNAGARKPVLRRAPVSERVRTPSNPRPGETGAPEMSRIPQARTLYEQAMRDKEGGNTVSAHMNLKLALSFDRTNAMIKTALRELSGGTQTSDLEKQGMDPEAKKMLEDASEAEARNDFDEAIALLERALEQSKDPALFNRLGVIIAMRKRDLARGRELVERALEIDPESKTYRHNLEKIAQMAKVARAEERVASQSPSPPEPKPRTSSRPPPPPPPPSSDDLPKPERKGLFGLFGKKTT
jgi:hypothetical protein